jgi:hypothetical protein
MNELDELDFFSRKLTEQNLINEIGVKSYRKDKKVRNYYVLRRYLAYKAWREFYSGRLRYKMNKIITLRWHVQLRS